MFDLDRAIDDWCQSVHTAGYNRKAHVEELKDHLYSEIEQLQLSGVSLEQAFYTAIERMGSTQELAAEHAKNRNTVGKCLEEFAKENLTSHAHNHSSINTMKPALLNIAISIFFAIAIIVSSLLLKNSETSQTAQFFLIALWFVPFFMLNNRVSGKHGSVQSEFRCIGRKIACLFNRG